MTSRQAIRRDESAVEGRSDSAAPAAGVDSKPMRADDTDPRILRALTTFRESLPRESLLSECVEAVALLEESTCSGYADRRIELAWHIVNTLLYDNRHGDTCARALIAAYPPESIVKDRVWERRWLTARAVTERIRGNIAQSLKAEAAGLDLSQEIGDLVGQASALANLASHALLSARFDEALQLSELAVGAAIQSSNLGQLANARVIRGNTLLYLGRYEEALHEAHGALVSAGPISSMPDKRRMVLAKALAAESMIAAGRPRDAAVAVASAERWAEESGAWVLVFEARRVRALLDVASGEVRRGLDILQDLRRQLAKETPSLLVDLLQSEYRARSMAQDPGGALQVLKELRAYFVAQAEETLKGLGHAPALTQYLQQDPRMADLDRYLESKRLLTRVASPANTSLEYLVALAASSVSPEDPSLEHGLRVGRLASLVATRLRLGEEFEVALFVSGLVHDVGKVGVPPELLLTQEALSDEELAIYEAHAETGAQLIEQAEIPNKRLVINAVRFHHVPFDGLGGRSSNRGEAIPVEARIVCACDAFDVLIGGRPRQSALTIERSLEDIFRRSGRDFDPMVVDALVDVIRRLPKDRAGLLESLSAGVLDIPYFANRRALNRATVSALAGANVIKGSCAS